MSLELSAFLANLNSSFYFAYVVIFLPNDVVSEDDGWIFLKNNAENEEYEVDLYAGKESSTIQHFNVKEFHKGRINSTIRNHVDATGKRAFQLVVFDFATEARSACQESIFQVCNLI